MKEDISILVETSKKKTLDALGLVSASLKSISLYDEDIPYTPTQREPFDALCDRFVRSVELAVKFFKTYELFMFAESSDSIRDLLNRMEKLRLISSVILWIEMRQMRNRIVHDYLPDQLKVIYDDIQGPMGGELLELQNYLIKLEI